MLVETGQTPFDVVQTSEFVPVLNPVTEEVFKVVVVTEEPPEITDQEPVPIVGMVLFKVVIDAQIV